MKNILELLKLKTSDKGKGVWVSGKKWEGEYKQWYSEGELCVHSFWKEGERHGELKHWDSDGTFIQHTLWERGKLIKDYMYG